MGVEFSGNLLDAGEEIQLLAYEDNLSETPVFSNVFSTPTDAFGFHVVMPSTFWSDHQGAFTITALVGSVNLSFVRARNYDSQRIPHSREFDVAPVPLPAALPLFLSALAGLGFVGWRRRTA